MKGSTILSTLLSALLLLAVAGPLMNTNFVQEAKAFNLFPCEQASTTIKYRTGNGMGGAYLTATLHAAKTWNDVPAGSFLDSVTSGEVILVQAASLGLLNAPLGQTEWPPDNNPCDPSTGFMKYGIITLNIDLLGTAPFEKVQFVAAHEFGHAIGFEHTSTSSNPNADKTLMFASAAFNTYNIFVPTLDEVRGLQTMYGSGIAKTPQCYPFTTSGGSVTWTGTCSSTNAALPMTEKITVAGTNRAFASQSQLGQAMPSTEVALMMAKVKPNTAYRFSMGVHTTNNVADPTNRMATIELNNNGIVASYVNTGGTVTSTTIWSGTVSTTTTYFLEVLVEKSTTGLTSAAVYAYKDDGGGTTSPTFLGSARFTSGINWSTDSTMFFGTGVWTDSSSNPLSSYQVTEYYNRMRST